MAMNPSLIRGCVRSSIALTVLRPVNGLLEGELADLNTRVFLRRKMGQTEKEIREALLDPMTSIHRRQNYYPHQLPPDHGQLAYSPHRELIKQQALPVPLSPDRTARVLESYGNHHFTQAEAAFVVMSNAQQQSGGKIMAVTFHLSSHYHAKVISDPKPAQRIARWLRDLKLFTDIIIVLEGAMMSDELEKNDPTGKELSQALHVHLVGLTLHDETTVRKKLKRYVRTKGKQPTRSELRIDYTKRRVRPYCNDVIAQEDAIGALPVGKPDFSSDWGGWYRGESHLRHLMMSEQPIDLGYINYLCKFFSNDRDVGYRISFVGLKGRAAFHRLWYDLRRQHNA